MLRNSTFGTTGKFTCSVLMLPSRNGIAIPIQATLLRQMPPAGSVVCSGT